VKESEQIVMLVALWIFKKKETKKDTTKQTNE
jgi:hypothetical protein